MQFPDIKLLKVIEVCYRKVVNEIHVHIRILISTFLEVPIILIFISLRLMWFKDKFRHISIFVFFVIKLWYHNDIRYTK